MFVNPMDEQLVRLSSEITFLRGMVEEFKKELAEAKVKIAELEKPKRKHIKQPKPVPILTEVSTS